MKALTDADMEAIAEQIAEEVLTEPIEQTAAFVVRLYLAEKGGQRVSDEPMQQDGQT